MEIGFGKILKWASTKRVVQQMTNDNMVCTGLYNGVLLKKCGN